MTIEILNPTYEEPATGFDLAPRPDSLDGLTVGIISNGKHATAPFFDALSDELRTRQDVADVVRIVKANYSAPAGDDVLDHARTWHALVAGVGD